MNRFFVWYTTKDGYEHFKAFKSKKEADKVINIENFDYTTDFRKISVPKMMLAYLSLYFNIFLDFIHGKDYHKPFFEEFSNEDCNPYEASSGKLIREVFNDLNINPLDSVLDVGSGKGYVLHVLADYPFQHISGIELSQKLYEISRENLKDEFVSVAHADATEFKGYDKYNYIVMFNPFDGEIMDEVLSKITKPGTTIIYNNPVCKTTFSEHGFHVVNRYRDWLGFDCWIYKN